MPYQHRSSRGELRQLMRQTAFSRWLSFSGGAAEMSTFPVHSICHMKYTFIYTTVLGKKSRHFLTIRNGEIIIERVNAKAVIKQKSSYDDEKEEYTVLLLSERGRSVQVLTNAVEGRLGVVRSAVPAGRRTGRPPLSVNKCAQSARIRVVPRS